jgi:hypothetical protein
MYDTNEAAVGVVWLFDAMETFVRIWEGAWAAIGKNEKPGSIFPLVHHTAQQ